MGTTEMKLTKLSQIALMGVTCYYPYEQRQNYYLDIGERFVEKVF